VFLFGGLISTMPNVGILCWAPISAVIAASPNFIGFGPVYKKPKPSVRQEVIILVLSNLLLSCWFQLYFLTQSWLENYPSLLAEDLSHSPFVVQWVTPDRSRSRGFELLNQAELFLKAQLEGQSWAMTERWLLDLNKQIPWMQTSVIGELKQLEENPFWRLEARILPGEYTLQLLAVWQGPTRKENGYYLARTCQITQIRNPISTPKSGMNPLSPDIGRATVQCSPIIGPTDGQPEPDVQSL
jgi:hypothetical protein